ncbi:Surfeit locus protein 6, putative [Trypanosoma equiperdum]|uniref:Ribosomal RNA-processing protein 14/surfeit locus protein 6 C-terminal domain-containing protein n=4 Tax=Trypanozoon TaxID=39700 RepID=Q385I7_TRYB2|nr:hypothetical protein, conserved [Trypanosoma brucei gambiense DAL972]XP_828656.1 hypothetical protein, conserved [Trypanosoma brucei brucei TREU927]RHW67110.1 Surfeit locus protein 6 [Trypanosoma brucei equiperdum]SCU66330.1 Surfeit locus protein 6, putative [Trypanosoma equiperdum]EAN79544.1 hypothetical protein, conserved [Trypanosoma brucei brucei TREU927]CBH17538.1 hypothetical protein, conserved [Trypanosoma brucei gambiense DAL972]|eukprot:XP_011779802.1 hypothetical protein, conserved [Trypanosoma brucei gambiense DAL972]
MSARGSQQQSTATASIPLNLSFGNFDFDETKRLGQRGGGVRELAKSLRRAQRQAAAHSQMLKNRGGLEQRNAELLGTAMRRAAGERVKDDPKRLAKALAKRRSKKRTSARKWAGRLEQIQQSVDNVVEDRATTRAKKRRVGKTGGDSGKKKAAKTFGDKGNRKGNNKKGRRGGGVGPSTGKKGRVGGFAKKGAAPTGKKGRPKGSK